MKCLVSLVSLLLYLLVPPTIVSDYCLSRIYVSHISCRRLSDTDQFRQSERSVHEFHESDIDGDEVGDDKGGNNGRDVLIDTEGEREKVKKVWADKEKEQAAKEREEKEREREREKERIRKEEMVREREERERVEKEERERVEQEERERDQLKEDKARAEVIGHIPQHNSPPQYSSNSRVYSMYSYPIISYGCR